ncbi:hypothetical protein Q428_12920 [Fervidicella metallireducens AeB]|uniref:YbbR-like protein n=1 Tax=Fervidicella metallireducens AeB TaxID=1403537 RepID=A0A017RRY3_9CLOT|nr:CdaR family protein [Fervidicella metallireducens]EYE87503.1 hypothetical protein Q428_12920 [Fervidicella metallireducens AeB]
MAHKDKKEITVMVLSVLLAFLMWIYVVQDTDQEINTIVENVPVILANENAIQESNLALANPGQQLTINLAVKGAPRDIMNVRVEDFRVEADMDVALKKGLNNIPIRVTRKPLGVDIVQNIETSYVKVTLDKLERKSVPIRLNLVGVPKSGYGYMQPVLRPTEVLISGPATQINFVEAAVGRIDVTENSADVKASIPLKPVDREGRIVEYVKIEPSLADVYLSIKPTKEVPIIVKKTGKLPEGKVLKYMNTSISKVTIVGDLKYLNEIKYIETVPFDLSNIQENITQELPFNIPPNINISGDIKGISVEFGIENKTSKTVDVSVSILNANDSYNYVFSSNTISVTIEGAESIVKDIDSSNISAVVDIKDFAEGVHIIPVKIYGPDGTQITSYTPQRITVTITKK